MAALSLKIFAASSEAAEFVRYLTSRQAQLRFTRELGWTPVRRDLYEDPEALRTNPYYSWLKDALPRIVVARPAAVSGKKYTAVSEAYAKAVHDVLTRQKSPADAMAELEKTLVQLTGFPIRNRPPPSRRDRCRRDDQVVSFAYSADRELRCTLSASEYAPG